MNSFLIRRLMPFYAFAIVSELIFKVGLSVYHFHDMDFSIFALIKTLGILTLTTSVAFIFMAIPYVIYLLFLPKARAESKADRIITTIFFFIFALLTYFEIFSSAVFWNEFESAFNFIAVDYLVYTHEVIANIIQSYPMAWIITTIVILSLITTAVAQKYIVPQVSSPRFLLKLLHTLLYGFVCLLAFRNVDISNLEISHNRFNNEIAKQGTYSLFSAFWKNEIDYDDFYITANTDKNLEILQNKFAGTNITFIEPKKSIARQINSFRPEKRANIIIILMESMSSKFLNENRPQEWQRKITPNLSKLAEESLFFSNTYAIGTRSVRGIEAVNLSVPPLPGMSIVRRDNNENLYSLGAIFKEKGYDNKWIYGGYGYFDNMNYFLENNGFQVVDRATWQKDEITFTNAWGTCDEDLFNKIITEADKSYAHDKPFLTLALTISNHRPYTYPDEKVELPSKISGREGGVLYADYAIGKFLEQAKQKPWFDNTIFVFVADHTAGAAGAAEIELEDHHIPLFIYAPKFVKAQRIDTPISQIDILPTLLGLLDFSYESHFYGQDALSPTYESRIFVSNYQKVGYVKNNQAVILKPVRQYSTLPETLDAETTSALLTEAVAFYQNASKWEENFKNANEHP